MACFEVINGHRVDINVTSIYLPEIEIRIRKDSCCICKDKTTCFGFDTSGEFPSAMICFSCIKEIMERESELTEKALESKYKLWYEKKFKTGYGRELKNLEKIK